MIHIALNEEKFTIKINAKDATDDIKKELSFSSCFNNPNLRCRLPYLTNKQ